MRFIHLDIHILSYSERVSLQYYKIPDKAAIIFAEGMKIFLLPPRCRDILSMRNFAKYLITPIQQGTSNFDYINSKIINPIPYYFIHMISEFLKI